MSSEVVLRLADQVLALQSAFDPLNASMLGVDGYSGRLPDVSADEHARLRAAADSLVVQAQAVDRADLMEDDIVTVDVVRQQALALIDRIDAGVVEYTVTDNNYVGPAAMMLSLMPAASMATREDFHAYLDRLANVPGYLAAVTDRHLTGVAVGRVPVRRLVDAAVGHLDRYLSAPGDDPLLRSAPAGAGRAFYCRRAALVSDVVRPALARYRRCIAEQVAPYARDDDRPGLCWLPGGDATYAALSRVHTTTHRDPEQLHRLGHEMIRTLQDEYAQLGHKVLGLSRQADIFRRLATDPAMRWRSAEELLASARAAVARAEEAMPRWFGVLPRQRCEVQPVPAAEAPGAPTAYYYQPLLDGSRPGIYYANTFEARKRARFTSEVTAFHEAAPGHHLQLTIAIERTELPLLRRLADINATIEGWALYAERLADEMGIYSGDLTRIGMLTRDSLRAARLVVDTGLHALGWTRQQAVGYLRENTPLTDLEADGEVDRYIAYAGQALSYMVGRLEIQRMRSQMAARLGTSFQLKAFHDLILTSAPLPVDVLDAMLDRHAAKVAAHSSERSSPEQ